MAWYLFPLRFMPHQLPSLFQWLDAFAKPVATFGEISIVEIAPSPKPTSTIEATFNDTILLEQAAISTNKDGADVVIDGTALNQGEAAHRPQLQDVVTEGSIQVWLEHSGRTAVAANRPRHSSPIRVISREA